MERSSNRDQPSCSCLWPLCSPSHSTHSNSICVCICLLSPGAGLESSVWLGYTLQDSCFFLWPEWKEGVTGSVGLWCLKSLTHSTVWSWHRCLSQSPLSRLDAVFLSWLWWSLHSPSSLLSPCSPFDCGICVSQWKQSSHRMSLRDKLKHQIRRSYRVPQKKKKGGLFRREAWVFFLSSVSCQSSLQTSPEETVSPSKRKQCRSQC